MDYQLVLSNLKIVELWFLVTVDNDVSCHMIWWRVFKGDPRVKNDFWPINARYSVRKQRLLSLPGYSVYSIIFVKSLLKLSVSSKLWFGS